MTGRPSIPLPPPAGPVSLSGVRLNQLDLVRQLTGRLGLSGSKIFLKADSAGAPKIPEYYSSSSLGEGGGGGGGGNGGAAAAGALDLEVAVKDIRRTLNLVGAESLSSEPTVAAAGGSRSSEAIGRVAAPAPTTPTTLTNPTTVVVEDDDEAGDSHFLLRCGALALSADVYDDGGEFHMQVRHSEGRGGGGLGGEGGGPG